MMCDFSDITTVSVVGTAFSSRRMASLPTRTSWALTGTRSVTISNLKQNQTRYLHSSRNTACVHPLIPPLIRSITLALLTLSLTLTLPLASALTSPSPSQHLTLALTTPHPRPHSRQSVPCSSTNSKRTSATRWRSSTRCSTWARRWRRWRRYTSSHVVTRRHTSSHIVTRRHTSSHVPTLELENNHQYFRFGPLRSASVHFYVVPM